MLENQDWERLSRLVRGLSSLRVVDLWFLWGIGFHGVYRVVNFI